MELITAEEPKSQVKKGYKKTDVGLIPEDWNYVEIGDKVNLLTGFPFPSSKYSTVGIRLLKGSNVKRGRTDWSEQITNYWNDDSANLKAYQLKEGDLVISMDGSLVGRSYALLTKQDLPALLLQRVARIRSNEIDINYLNFFVGSDWFIKHSDSVKTVTAIPHISPKDIRSFKIPLPPTLAEQKAISKALSDVDALISNLDTLITKKKAIKQGAMQQLLKSPKQGGKRLPGFEGEWEEKTLGEVAEVISGGTPKTAISSYWADDIWWCTPTDITSCKGKYISSTEKKISKLGLKNSSANLLPKGTLLLCSRATIGVVRIANMDITTNQGFKSLVCNPRVIDNEFLYYLLLTKKNDLIEKAIGSTFLEISKKDTKNLIITVPPTLSEQKAIATTLSDMDADIESLEKKKAKYQSIKQGMMQELLTGKTRLV